MAAALRRWAAGLTRKHQSTQPFPSSIYPMMLEKVKGMRKVGAPTEDTSRFLLGIEDRLKVYNTLWEVNESQVQGLLRNGLKCRAFIAFLTVGSGAGLAKGADVAYEFLKA